MCCGLKIGESQVGMGGQQYNIVPNNTTMAPSLENDKNKWQKVDVVLPMMSPSLDCKKSVESFQVELVEHVSPSLMETEADVVPELQKFGTNSTCGRRRDMEDTVAIHPSFYGQSNNIPSEKHFFGVYDDHDCSHIYNLLLFTPN